MHSVQNESLCMYIVILLCIVYQTLTIFVFFFLFFFLKKKKQLAAWHIDTWLTYSHVPKLHVAVWPRTLEQVATWPHVNNPHGHVDTCNKYTCPNGHMY
jgi:branched-subunit amino acid transport protein